MGQLVDHSLTQLYSFSVFAISTIKYSGMPFLFVLFAINILSVSLIVFCSKKENENVSYPGTLKDLTENPKTESSMELNFSEVRIEMTADESSRNNLIRPRRADVYHAAAENLAWPASIRCKNHDDVWRTMALYLDYIRAVNPKEFEQYRLLDSALAVLHDLGHYIRAGQLSNDTIALAVVYFLVDFHRIKINQGNAQAPWYTILCRAAQLDELERVRVLIEHELVGNASRSDEPTALVI